STTYRARVVVTNPTGTTAGKFLRFTTLPPLPALSAEKLHPNPFRAASSGPSVLAPEKNKPKTGTLVIYDDSQAARTTFTVLQLQPGVREGGRCVRPPKHPNTKPKPCRRLVSLGSFTHTDRAGSNHLHFTGRVHGRKLKPGRYKLRAIARNT